jgi:hypothetical protein
MTAPVILRKGKRQDLTPQSPKEKAGTKALPAMFNVTAGAVFKV